MTWLTTVLATQGGGYGHRGPGSGHDEACLGTRFIREFIQKVLMIFKEITEMRQEKPWLGAGP